ncbi:MAG: hypothetical protein E5W72_16775 [Mesorhizobium sp.]|uniref:hypothetical protein n=1 Tax=Mesorhizobium sp. TaxID=1871066 RepID=UPI001222E29A|nr:hypothetical protein [Mesorhizobium sp.]TIS99202.1 MAG: hypothetical protein E5W87_22785 [Mesorhizobium sp.]TIT48982.1 MAG: hypothetical protein E5W72_16775 [Mesorhizobium sp.]
MSDLLLSLIPLSDSSALIADGPLTAQTRHPSSGLAMSVVGSSFLFANRKDDPYGHIDQIKLKTTGFQEGWRTFRSTPASPPQ